MGYLRLVGEIRKPWDERQSGSISLVLCRRVLSINALYYTYLSGHFPRVDRLTSSQSGWLLPSERSHGGTKERGGYGREGKGEEEEGEDMGGEGVFTVPICGVIIWQP